MFLNSKMNAESARGEGDSNINYDGGTRRTFQGLRKQFWYILGCSASTGLQRELLRYILGV